MMRALIKLGATITHFSGKVVILVKTAKATTRLFPYRVWHIK
ncbi:MAG: hypothetical protein UT24_C0020G0016 [Candidatus Woesebacteria bacterium GW2011_GWB1_39_12]|uniref:Uncharacterized protein n=1 Tax=Candidatus Woesebacteria bacterium GW2011_GWB1_39_12 TaxID=1618574 RepID=A0A0G0M723_9BACT|nr:MAG: hypothetical protein UT24_C0020G0016 [Candidatus Woesebacteria bacterium GW2011_GWB1_39_12]